MNTDDIIDKKLSYWGNKLIDLSKRNNLISYRFTKSKSIQIASPDLNQVITDLDHESNIRFQKDNTQQSKQWKWICSEDQDIVEKKLYRLFLTAKNNFQELGVNTCFVSIGVICYTDSKSSDIIIKAPIFLYPVEISKLSTISKETHRFEIASGSGELQLNPAIKEKLYHDYKIEIQDINERSPSEYLQYLRATIEAMSDWGVNEEIYLDIFSYQKYIMFHDLKKYKELVKESPLIRAYVGDQTALQDEIYESIQENFDDSTSIDVLPADSSQKRAVELAKAGVTYVLQGPPGTGKSQTIVNIIAALIQQKKKILFVSQKMAALNVVQKRLDNIGLGRYCLNLHTYKGNKREIIKQLMSELLNSPKISDSVKQFRYDNYLMAQNEINDFYRFLCEKHTPWGLSVYDIRGKLSKLNEVELVDISLKSILGYDLKQIDMLIGKLNRIQSHFKTIKNPVSNIYFDFIKEKNTSLELSRFISKVNSIDTEKLQNLIDEIKENTGHEIVTFEELQSIIQIKNELNSTKFESMPEYFIFKEFDTYFKFIKEMEKLTEQYLTLYSSITSKVHKDFLTNDTTHFEDKLKTISFFDSIFNRNYKQIKTQLNSYSNEKLSKQEWLTLLQNKQQAFKIKEDIKILLNNHQSICKDIEGIQNITVIIKLLDYANNLNRFYIIAKKIDPILYRKIIEYIYSTRTKENDIIKTLQAQTNDINNYFRQPSLKPEGDINNFIKKITLLQTEYQYIQDMIFFRDEYDSFEPIIQQFIDLYSNQDYTQSLEDLFQKTYYMQILDELLKKENKLSPKELIKQFNDDDFKIRDNYRYQIMESLEKLKPKHNYQTRGSSGSNEVNILKRENEKKRRLKPLRELLTQIPNLVFSLKPCFMMSPLTVSQYIDPENLHFDVLIFDEASQIMPEDAVTCLIRADQVIVMGDTQQLPPTTFFMSQEDEDVEEEIEDLESFLSEASVKFRSKSLDWHYRSRNENLIAFSNFSFYENRLVTFPNPDTLDKSGLEFRYVHGIYDRGKSRKNMIEAKEIVTLYRSITKEYPEKSTGIIAFSMAQEKAIRDAFVSENIDFDEIIDTKIEETFIKNLETVQGDERDIIILSIGYGKDSSGMLSYNFGPINKEGGYKRLNVAITRSRYKTIIVSSIQPEELDNDKIHSEGLQHLKNYMDYAKNKKIEKIFAKKEAITFDSTFEESVYETLEQKGYLVCNQVGCSGYRIDLAIKHPEKPWEYILGIECDGAQYHSSKYARDRDKVRQEILKGLGWNIHRIWSDDWVNNRENELNKIDHKINEIIKSNKKKQYIQQTQFKPIELEETFRPTSLRSSYKSYNVADLTYYPIYSNEIEYHRQIILDRIKKVLLEESPMEKELLYKRILHSMGIQKLGLRLKSYLDYCLQNLINQKQVYISDKTVSLNQIKPFYDVRVSTDDQRPFTLIPKEELAGAIIDIIENTFSIEKDAVIADVAKGIYHYNRVGQQIENKINDTINHLIKHSIIDIENGRLTLSKVFLERRKDKNTF
jgi:superfamily I DNA and/or RNA helicase